MIGSWQAVWKEGLEKYEGLVTSTERHDCNDYLNVHQWIMQNNTKTVHLESQYCQFWFYATSFIYHSKMKP